MDGKVARQRKGTNDPAAAGPGRARLERIAGQLGVSVAVLEQYLQAKQAETVPEEGAVAPHREERPRRAKAGPG